MILILSLYPYYKFLINERVAVEVPATCAAGQEINRAQAQIIGDGQVSPQPHRRPLSHQTSRLLQKCITSHNQGRLANPASRPLGPRAHRAAQLKNRADLPLGEVRLGEETVSWREIQRRNRHRHLHLGRIQQHQLPSTWTRLPQGSEDILTTAYLQPQLHSRPRSAGR